MLTVRAMHLGNKVGSTAIWNTEIGVLAGAVFLLSSGGDALTRHFTRSKIC